MEISKLQMRDAFIVELFERAKGDKDIIFISNEFGSESLDVFRSELPEQFINAGISEQNIISVAAGLSIEGKKVFVYSIASFITLRCFEQIKIDVCSMNLPVTIIGVGTAYSYSTDGPSHHATEDISLMRSLVNMGIYSPSDSNVAYNLVDISVKSKNPLYIRMDRVKLPLFYQKNENICKGYKTIKEGEKVCIITNGIMTNIAFGVSEELKKQKKNIKIIDLFRLKPVNITGLISEFGNIDTIFTLEEHTLNGGIGSIVAEIITDNNLPIKLSRLGITDSSLYCYGVRETIHKNNKLDVKNIKDKIIKSY